MHASSPAGRSAYNPLQSSGLTCSLFQDSTQCLSCQVANRYSRSSAEKNDRLKDYLYAVWPPQAKHDTPIVSKMARGSEAAGALPG